MTILVLTEKSFPTRKGMAYKHLILLFSIVPLFSIGFITAVPVYSLDIIIDPEDCDTLLIGDHVFIGNIFAQNCDNVEIERSTVFGNLREIKNCELFRITDNTIFGNIFADDCKNVIIEGSTVYSNIEESGDISVVVGQEEIKNCQLSSIIGATVFDNIFVDSCETVTIEGSTIFANIVEVKNCKTLSIKGSAIFGNIRADGCEKIEFEDITIFRNIEELKNCKILSIKGSAIFDNIFVDGCENVTVSDNTISGDLEILNVSVCGISGNTIHGARIVVDNCI